MQVGKVGFTGKMCTGNFEPNIPIKNYYSNPIASSSTDSVSFSSNRLKTNQIMPATDKLIKKAAKSLPESGEVKNLVAALPEKLRVTFSQNEPKRYLLVIDKLKSKSVKHSDDIIFDLDYRLENEGKITEFIGNDMLKGNDKQVDIKRLNQKVRYYLSALFPQKNIVNTL